MIDLLSIPISPNDHAIAEQIAIRGDLALSDAETSADAEQIREHASLIAKVAEMRDLPQVRYEATLLVTLCERAIVTMNPPIPPSERSHSSGAEYKKLGISRSTMSQMRAVHNKLTSAEFDDVVTDARNLEKLITREYLKSVLKKKLSNKKPKESIQTCEIDFCSETPVVWKRGRHVGLCFHHFMQDENDERLGDQVYATAAVLREAMRQHR